MAAAAKLLQSCLSLQPHRQKPTRLSLEFSRQEYWSGVPFPSMHERKSENEVTQLCPTLSDYTPIQKERLKQNETEPTSQSTSSAHEF